jgi:hypothetical protein
VDARLGGVQGTAGTRDWEGPTGGVGTLAEGEGESGQRRRAWSVERLCGRGDVRERGDRRLTRGKAGRKSIFSFIFLGVEIIGSIVTK